jgi:hypothetical protein
MTFEYMYNVFAPDSRSTGYQSKSEEESTSSGLRKSSESSRAILDAIIKADGSGKTDGFPVTLLGLVDVFVHLGKFTWRDVRDLCKQSLGGIRTEVV